MFSLSRRNQTTGFRTWLLAFVILLAAFVLPVRAAYAAEASDATDEYYENAFLLTISTGSNDGRSVEAIRLHYSREDNGQYDEVVIYPKTDYRDSLKVITRDPDVPEIKGLQADTVNSFLVRPAHKAKSFDKIEVIMHDSGTWTCNGMTLISLDEVYDLDTRFAADGTCFVKCRGEVWGHMTTSQTADGYQNLTIRHSSSTVKELPMNWVREPYESLSASSSYIFRMDLADFYQAGLESLQPFAMNESQMKSYKDNGLSVIVRYTDTGGSIRTLRYPVVSSAIAYAKKLGVSEDELLAGLIEQGGTVCFEMDLPDYGAFIDYTFDYSDAEDKKDDFSVVGLSFYDTEKVSAEASVADGYLQYSFGGDPDYYYRSSSIVGANVKPGQRVTFNKDQDIRPYEEGAALLPKDNRELYLVEIKTENVQGAAATGEVIADISYLQQNNKLNTEKGLVLSEVINDYYGYDTAAWEEGKTKNLSLDKFEYYYHTSEGQALRFYIELEDVKQFKSVTIEMNDMKDSWQISAITIYRVDGYGNRLVQWGDKNTLAVDRIGFYSNRDYARGRTGMVNTVAATAESVLIQNGNTVVIPFDSTEVIADDKDMFDRNPDGLSYDEICKEYGFTKARGNYIITVEVADDSLTDFNMGDCGSENYFYFQLLFENGNKSPIVLANQQLSGDAFRAGEDATFAISTNRDYGDIEAIRIIPDSSSSDSEIFDKLKINNIYVTQDSAAGVQMTWCFENIGWIDITYHDDGEKKVGQTIDELARDFDRTDKTYSVKLEFAVTTEANLDGTQQFSGNIQAEIEYLDKNSRPQIKPVDITKLIYNYNDNSKYIYDESTKEITSDPAQMFRFGKADRFEVAFTNISMLKSITFKVRGNQDGMEWTVGGVSVSYVKSGGMVRLNSDGEYQKTSDMEEFCYNQTELPQTMYNLSPTNRQTFAVSFTGNKIDFSADDVEIRSRTAASVGDRMNLYVTMKDGADSTLLYPMQAEVEYSTVNGKHMSSLATLTPSDDGRSAYITGMSAAYMNTITAIHIYAIGENGTHAEVNYAAVEQYRSDESGKYQHVVNDYYFNMEGRNAALTGGVTGSPTEQTLGSNTEKIYFGVSQAADVLKLIPETRDVCARILYNSTCAPNGDVFVTDDIYLSKQNITELATGKTVSFEYKQNLVDQIVGLELRTIGGNMEIGVDAIYADLFETIGGMTVLKNSSAMIHEQTAAARPATWRKSKDDGPVMPIELAFTTASAQGTATGNGGSPVRVTVAYVDESGKHMNRSYNDIRQALDPAGDFYAGQTQTARLLIPEAVYIEGISIEPYDEDPEKIASWKVDKVDLAFLKEGAFVYTDSRIIENFIFEGNPYIISTEPAIVMADVAIVGGAASTTERVANDSVSYLLNDGASFHFTVIRNGANSDYRVIAEQVTLSGAKVAAEEGLLVRSGTDSYVFSPPEKDIECYYRITVESMVSSDAKIEFTLTVPARVITQVETVPEQQTQPESGPAPETEPAAESEPETTEAETSEESAEQESSSEAEEDGN